MRGDLPAGRDRDVLRRGQRDGRPAWLLQPDAPRARGVRWIHSETEPSDAGAGRRRVVKRISEREIGIRSRTWAERGRTRRRCCWRRRWATRSRTTTSLSGTRRRTSCTWIRRRRWRTRTRRSIWIRFSRRGGGEWGSQQVCEHLRQIEGCPSVQIKEMPRVYNAEKRVGEEEERGPEAGEESREGGEGSEG